MTEGIEILKRAVGRDVCHVAVNVLFYGAETEGVLASVSLILGDDAEFSLGCAGNGGVYVRRLRQAYGDAPGFTTRRHRIEGVCGELRAASSTGNVMRLLIVERELVLANEDDELLIKVDGEALPYQILTR